MSQTGDAENPGPVPSRAHNVALVLAIAAVAAPVLYFLFFPLLGVAALGAVIAIVLSIRALVRGDRRRVVGWTIVLATVGLIVDVVLFALAANAVWVPRYDSVELRATGTAFVAEFADDSGPHSQEWEGDGWFQRYNTERSWVELTITRAPEATGPVSCTILWNDVVVIEESSDDVVLCRYER